MRHPTDPRIDPTDDQPPSDIPSYEEECRLQNRATLHAQMEEVADWMLQEMPFNQALDLAIDQIQRGLA